MDLFKPIDIYCERLDPSFWAEPVNAITNLSFIIAALVIFRALIKANRYPKFLVVLTANVFLIGVGSFLFHTHANTWSMLADVLPITIMICLTIFYFLKYFFNLGWVIPILGAAGIIVVGQILETTFAGALNGSVAYAHALAALLAMAYFARGKSKAVADSLKWASITFLISLTFRSIDMSICESFPLGTHFMWHSLNGLMLWMILNGVKKLELES